jgi:hypothetical protein
VRRFRFSLRLPPPCGGGFTPPFDPSAAAVGDNLPALAGLNKRSKDFRPFDALLKDFSHRKKQS